MKIPLIEGDTTHINYFTEKIFFGTLNLIGGAIAAIGAILSEDDTRWFCITLTVGIIVSTCMALMTRNTESMKVVSGRFLFALTCTVLATRLVPYVIPSMAEAIYNDVLLLGVVSIQRVVALGTSITNAGSVGSAAGLISTTACGFAPVAQTILEHRFTLARRNNGRP